MERAREHHVDIAAGVELQRPRNVLPRRITANAELAAAVVPHDVGLAPRHEDRVGVAGREGRDPQPPDPQVQLRGAVHVGAARPQAELTVPVGPHHVGLATGREEGGVPPAHGHDSDHVPVGRGQGLRGVAVRGVRQPQLPQKVVAHRPRGGGLSHAAAAVHPTPVAPVTAGGGEARVPLVTHRTARPQGVVFARTEIDVLRERRTAGHNHRIEAVDLGHHQRHHLRFRAKADPALPRAPPSLVGAGGAGGGSEVGEPQRGVDQAQTTGRHAPLQKPSQRDGHTRFGNRSMNLSPCTSSPSSYKVF